ncbi:delta-like protein A [Halichondria panicea]|uniref:delta-like protein A n=1 Tax=Halichondria panicea TaxID=6063 RepID=UPI00312BCAB6
MLLRMSVLVLCMSCLCLWLGKLSVLVSADYVVQVKMVSYSHPSNTLPGGRRCCDSPWEFNSVVPCNEGERCDTYFIYCLRPHASTATPCPSNEPGCTAVSNYIVDGADIDFTQPTVLGLSNPFNLTGISTAWEGAQLYIQVLDFDTYSSYDTIVRYRFNLNPSVSVGSTSTLYISASSTATARFSATVLCAPFYIGSSCDIFDYYHCESICRELCVDEIDSFTCNCNHPYFGANCEHQNFCYNRICNERGTCTNNLDSYTCVCNAGYTGVDCEDIDECEGQSCSGNGLCMDEVNSYTCVCNAGYTGADCEVDIDECLLMETVCSGHGNCSQGIATFTCSCDLGYTGQNCETDIDDCVNRNCSGNRVCVDGVNSFSCECVSGFTGKMCNTAGGGPEGITLIGGVVGGLLVLMLILLLLIVVVVVCVRIAHDQGKTIQDTQLQAGDNPVYGIPENRTNTITSETAEFDNPIYGSRESFNDVELVNPIYGDADFEDVPSELAPAISDYETPVVRRAHDQGKTNQDTQLQGDTISYIPGDTKDVPYELAPAVSDYETPI